MSAKTFARKGSQRWLQVAVERAPEVLNDPLRASLNLGDDVSIEWLSPLRSENFVEYKDGLTFQNKRWHLPLAKRPLTDFWPNGGAVWDGLARTSDGQFLLVEAKAHIPEIVSGPTRATQSALKKIQNSLADVQGRLAPKGVGIVDWSQMFYQYANRVAHLDFLRAQNNEKAHMVNIYFYNAPDVPSPPTAGHWQGAIQVVECYLGLGRHRMSKYMHKLFIDTAEVAKHCTPDE